MKSRSPSSRSRRHIGAASRLNAAARSARSSSPPGRSACQSVMRIVTHPDEGLFPKPTEIRMTCSCPDSARMCKHVAAVMYGVGARLDGQPDLLFILRKVEHTDVASAVHLKATRSGSKRKTIDDSQLSDVFGIEMADTTSPVRGTTAKKPVRRKSPAARAGSARESDQKSVVPCSSSSQH